MLVVDASVALAWCFADEATTATDALAVQARRDGAVVPAHWLLETLNALVVAERRGRIERSDVDAHARTLEDLGVEVDGETGPRAARATLALARREKLSVYAAAYLELALRRGLPLATLDGDLARAARKAGVPVLP
ncbi:MAG: type II toxin-antitoxin system VapC family toxin [Reyranella sp.]|nr:type II toxin-antitoxin system VapC family toxin [Reyranella sp.]